MNRADGAFHDDNVAAKHSRSQSELELELAGRVRGLLENLTLDEKAALMASRQPAVPRLGLPEFAIGGEAAHGFVSKDAPTSIFPQPIGLATTWDPELVRLAGETAGIEARAIAALRGGRGHLCLWAPTIDMERDPRWGRNEEGYGEDPLLTGRLAGAYVRGLQGGHPFYLRCVASPKHFYANNNENGRLDGSSNIDPRGRREYYLAAFALTFAEGKPRSLMTAYNAINGLPAMIHPDINNVVKGEWGMDGFVVCDGGALTLLHEKHRVGSDLAEAAALAIKAGIDSLTEEQPIVALAVRAALERGLLAEADLDRALARIFSVRFRLGLWAEPGTDPYAAIGPAALYKPEHAKLVRRLAEASVALLRNDGAPTERRLPLRLDNGERLAVIGPLADAMFRGWYGPYPDRRRTLLGALAARFGADDIDYDSGADIVELVDTAGRSFRRSSYYDDRLIAAGDWGDALEAVDWGEGNLTLKCVSSATWLSAAADGIRAGAAEPGGWQVRERFALAGGGMDAGSLTACDGRRLVRDVDGRLGYAPDKGEIAADEVPDGTVVRLRRIEDGTARAAALAGRCAAAVLCLGSHPLLGAKEEIDRDRLGLAPAQVQLARAVLDANPRTVIVLVSGYPFSLEEIGSAPAIVWATHGGPAMAEAVAAVLAGDVNPAGRLPQTWYRSETDLGDILDYDIASGGRTYRYFSGSPLFAFGHGLSYTDFSYDHPRTARSAIRKSESALVGVRVTNTGNLDGEEVVQVYGSCRSSRLRRPIRQLLGFRRIFLTAGASLDLNFKLSADQFLAWDPLIENWLFETADWTISFGSSSADLHAECGIACHGRPAPERSADARFRADSYAEGKNVALRDGAKTRRVGARAGGTAFLCYDRFRADHDFIAVPRLRGEFGPGAQALLRLDERAAPAAAVWHEAGDVDRTVAIAAGEHRYYLELSGEIWISELQLKINAMKETPG